MTTGGLNLIIVTLMKSLSDLNCATVCVLCFVHCMYHLQDTTAHLL